MTLTETTCAIGVLAFLVFVALGTYLPARQAQQSEKKARRA
jgi:type II secretory pathway pseudopilin PulG